MNAEKYLQNVHPDLNGLLFVEPKAPDETFQKNIEPSTIFLDLPVIEPKPYTSIVEPSKHFSPPTYAGLMAEHKFEYFDFLSDPYSDHHYRYDDYYILLLYYCLERHLMYGDFDRAYFFINTLRSKYSYLEKMVSSADVAIILTCLKKNQLFHLCDFLYNYTQRRCYCPFDIMIMAKYAIEKNFTYEDILRYRFTFGYVVKDLPDDYGVFSRKLQEIMIEETGLDYLEIDTLIEAKNSLESENIRVFLNNSLDMTAQIPKFHTFRPFTDACFYFLSKTHEFFDNPLRFEKIMRGFE